MNNPKVMDAVGLIGKFVTDNWEYVVDPTDMLDELENRGFSSREISDAFKWIERNTLGAMDARNEEKIPEADRPSVRILTTVEQSKLASGASALLQRIYDRGIIDVALFEEILDKALKSESEEVTEKEMRRIASLTVFTRVQAEWRDFLRSTNTLVH